MLMTKTEYAETLNGERWQALRKEFLDQHLCCERCEIPRWLAAIAYDQDLHAHHKSYANRGTDDEINDLEALCRRCHDIETFGRSDLRAPKECVCSSCQRRHYDPRSGQCSECQLVYAMGPRSVYDYILTDTPWGGEATWKDLLMTIREQVSLDEMLTALTKIEDIMADRERGRLNPQAPICYGDIPF